MIDVIDAATLARLRDARSAATGRLLERMSDGGPVAIDVDASLFEVHSEQKEHAASQFEGGFEFHLTLGGGLSHFLGDVSAA